VEGRTFGIPGPPGNLTWRAQGASIVLAWDAPLDDGGLPLAYAVWRATPMGQGSFVGETGATWFRDEGCLGVCAYAVSARNPLGEGPRTPEILAPGNARL
jgi:hypothetical protein